MKLFPHSKSSAWSDRRQRRQPLNERTVATKISMPKQRRVARCRITSPQSAEVQDERCSCLGWVGFSLAFAPAVLRFDCDGDVGNSCQKGEQRLYGASNCSRLDCAQPYFKRQVVAACPAYLERFNGGGPFLDTSAPTERHSLARTSDMHPDRTGDKKSRTRCTITNKSF